MKDIKILYEDENLIALDKPERLASISENELKVKTLHSLLEQKLNKKLFIVHRLDKEVSGVILFAKNAETHKHLNQQFNNRTIKKSYYALVHGIVSKDEGTIDKPIREFGSGRMGIDDIKGKPSETKYRVLERFPEFTLIELTPSTGRRHQLRVHLYSINHPIVGDLRYGDKTVQQKFPRIMLHAKQIEFQLPNMKYISIESSLPDSLTKVINELKTNLRHKTYE